MCPMIIYLNAIAVRSCDAKFDWHEETRSLVFADLNESPVLQLLAEPEATSKILVGVADDDGNKIAIGLVRPLIKGIEVRFEFDDEISEC